ncbi:GerAB/ArcD/ProY family transporter [Paenibacillus flagellatus]|uniref:GerAB/ArcD/ProY family transporter n=1 Tax=Paenibacillus flagellatus TaxID=2211139 RepID=UPI0013052109|nr:endospore germination permease [Paenibacillus flagellatus]
MIDNGRISVKQLAALVLFFVIGDNLLVYPSIAASVSKQDAWLSGLLGIMLGLGAAWFLFRFGRLKPDSTLVGFARDVLGRWAGGAVVVLYLCYFLINASVILREIGDFTTTQFFPNTPIQVIHLMVVFILVWGFKSGLETIARTGEVFFPIFALLLTSLFVFLMPQVEFSRVQPIMGQGLPNIVRGSMYLFTYSFCEMCLFLMILPSVVRNRHAARDFVLASSIGGIAVFAIATLSILVLGADLSAHYRYTSYVLAQKISIGHFVERVEPILAINWIISTYFKSMLNGYAFLIGISELLGLRDVRALAVPFGVLLFGLAYIVSPNVVFFSSMFPYWIEMDMLFGLFIPGVLFAVHVMKKGRSKRKTAKARNQ